MLQVEFERELRKQLSPGYGYRTDEIAFMLDLDKHDTITKCWKAKRHGVLRVKVINVKRSSKVHWKIITPRNKGYKVF